MCFSGSPRDGSIVSVRPSGTEPKIKFYFGVKAPLESVADFERVQAELDARSKPSRKTSNWSSRGCPVRQKRPGPQAGALFVILPRLEFALLKI